MNIDRQTIKHIVELRVVVGLLGERTAPKWWSSTFFDTSAKTFLVPVFPKTYVRTQYQGVVSVAALTHDEHIGGGNVFHLFRLPEIVEQDIHAAFDDEVVDIINNFSKDKEISIQFLSRFGESTHKLSPGPTHVGKISLLYDVSIWKQIASTYFNALNQNIPAFPFFMD